VDTEAPISLESVGRVRKVERHSGHESSHVMVRTYIVNTTAKRYCGV